MAEILNPNLSTPMKPVEATVGQEDKKSEEAHRRVEHEANKAAQRAEDRLKKDEAGSDLISNM